MCVCVRLRSCKIYSENFIYVLLVCDYCWHCCCFCCCLYFYALNFLLLLVRYFLANILFSFITSLSMCFQFQLFLFSTIYYCIVSATARVHAILCMSKILMLFSQIEFDRCFCFIEFYCLHFLLCGLCGICEYYYSTNFYKYF